MSFFGRLTAITGAGLSSLSQLAQGIYYWYIMIYYNSVFCSIMALDRVQRGKIVENCPRQWH